MGFVYNSSNGEVAMKKFVRFEWGRYYPQGGLNSSQPYNFR